MLYLSGSNGVTSELGNLNIVSNNANFNTLNVIDTNLILDGTYFADNLSKGGSNGINAVGSVMTANSINAV